MFVVIEGLDAAGKATQTKLLAESYRAAGRRVEVFSFPRYDTPLGRAILRHLKNEISMTESADDPCLSVRALEDALVFQCMMATDKLHAATAIRAAINDGNDVIADRYWPSGVVYGRADGISPTWLLDLHKSIPQPDVMVLLHCSPEEALKRRPVLRDRYERDRAKQEVIRENYMTLWRNQSVPRRWPIVPTDGRTIEEVAEEVRSVVALAR